jgi:hypothetical protein
MDEQLIQQAESVIRSGVRTVDAGRLRGEVKVVHWSAIKEAMERSLSQLKREVEGLLDQKRKLALADVGTSDVARLQAELAAARERLAALEEAYDFVTIIEDFNLQEFEKLCDELDGGAAELESAYSGKTAGNLPLSSSVEKMRRRARECEETLRDLCGEMLEERADVGAVVKMVKISKDGERLWARAETIKEYADFLRQALA